MLQRASLFTKDEKSDADEEDSDWVGKNEFIDFSKGLTSSKSYL